MSLEDRETGPDMRLAGEKYCIDCPDPEACYLGAPCNVVRLAVEEGRGYVKGVRAPYEIIDEASDLPASDPETDEERLNRTNNVWVIDKPKGTPMPNTEDQHTDHAPDDKSEEDRYDQDGGAGETRYEPQFGNRAVVAKDWIANFSAEKASRALAYCVLGAAVIGLLRRKTPKRVRVDYHHYVHAATKK